jgi:hypothetical protein
MENPFRQFLTLIPAEPLSAPRIAEQVIPANGLRDLR